MRFDEDQFSDADAEEVHDHYTPTDLKLKHYESLEAGEEGCIDDDGKEQMADPEGGHRNGGSDWFVTLSAEVKDECRHQSPHGSSRVVSH